MNEIKQLQNLLRLTFGIVPIVAGLDKFTNLLVRWPQYLGSLGDLLPMQPSLFMMIVGGIEVFAGVIVLTRPAVGSIIVMAWLIAISLSLLFSGYYDVAVRDLVMALSAFVLYRLTIVTASSKTVEP